MSHQPSHRRHRRHRRHANRSPLGPTCSGLQLAGESQLYRYQRVDYLRTVTRKARSRQQTVTVESQTSKEVQAVFDEVNKMDDLDDPVGELSRRIQRLFLQREKEWAYKLAEAEQANGEELALCKIKLRAAQKTALMADELAKHFKATSAGGSPQQSMTTPHRAAAAGATSPRLNGVGNESNGGAVSTDAFVEVKKERDHLRDELRELENSYSDLFKRYEKMRENCVLLKNSEELLKKNAEDDAAKYEKLATMFTELRDNATKELNRANMELVRLEKQHDDNTLSLRCRLKRCEGEINALNLTIEGKNAQLEELNKLCDDLMEKNGVIDNVGEDGDEINTEAGSYDDSYA